MSHRKVMNNEKDKTPEPEKRLKRQFIFGQGFKPTEKTALTIEENVRLPDGYTTSDEVEGMPFFYARLTKSQEEKLANFKKSRQEEDLFVKEDVITPSINKP